MFQDATTQRIRHSFIDRDIAQHRNICIDFKRRNNDIHTDIKTHYNISNYIVSKDATTQSIRHRYIARDLLTES